MQPVAAYACVQAISRLVRNTPGLEERTYEFNDEVTDFSHGSKPLKIAPREGRDSSKIAEHVLPEGFGYLLRISDSCFRRPEIGSPMRPVFLFEITRDRLQIRNGKEKKEQELPKRGRSAILSAANQIGVARSYSCFNLWPKLVCLAQSIGDLPGNRGTVRSEDFHYALGLMSPNTMLQTEAQMHVAHTYAKEAQEIVDEPQFQFHTGSGKRSP